MFSPVSSERTFSARTAVALSRQEIGLDEQDRTARIPEALFRRLEERERCEDFFRLWTAKEAYVKYRGETLARKLRSLAFYGGILYENGVPLPLSLRFETIGEIQLCVCTEEEEPLELRQL